MLKLQKQLEDGTISQEDAKDKIGGYIEKVMTGVAKIISDIQAPLKTLKEIQELQNTSKMLQTNNNPSMVPDGTEGLEEEDFGEAINPADIQIPNAYPQQPPQDPQGYFDEDGKFHFTDGTADPNIKPEVKKPANQPSEPAGEQ